MGFLGLRGWSASRLVHMNSLAAGASVVAIGGAIPVPPSSLSRSHSQSEAQGGATVQEPKRTRTVRRNRRHPAFGAARVVVWQHPAGARLKIHLISWGSCAKPRTVWLRPIFGGTGCRCTLLLLWYLARPRPAPSAHSLMQESTAPRRNRCWVHHCRTVCLSQPAGKASGTRDLLPCSATSTSVSYRSTSRAHSTHL